MVNSFKSEILSGTHTAADTYKIALYNSSATWDATMTVYAATNELATAGGYTQDSKVIATYTVGSTTSTSWVDFTTDPAWTSATFTARAAVIYNSSKSNKVLCVLDFGADKTATNGTFTVVLPTADASNALIRLT
jgi:hypothetical protein